MRRLNDDIKRKVFGFNIELDMHHALKLMSINEQKTMGEILNDLIRNKLKHEEVSKQMSEKIKAIRRREQDK